jgi:hypothetical protein
MVGLDAAAAAAGDWELADRLRHAAYCLNEVCTTAGLRLETQLRDQAISPAQSSPTGATLKAGVIKGRVPYRPDLAPPGLDKLFPEGPVAKGPPPGEVLIA